MDFKSIFYSTYDKLKPLIYLIYADSLLLSFHFVVHYYAYLFLTDAEFPRCFTSLTVFSGKKIKDHDYFSFSN